MKGLRVVCRGLLVLTLVLGASAHGQEAGSSVTFADQAGRLHAMLQTQCAQGFSILPSDDFSGAMFRCSNGAASFVAIAAKPPAPEMLHTIRVSWSDVFNANQPRQLHAGRGAALYFVTAAATLFAPDHVDEILEAFEGAESRSWVLDDTEVTYSAYRATLHDERTLTIAPRSRP